MSYDTALDIVNKAFCKIGGAGAQFGAKHILPNLTAQDKVTVFANTAYPQVRLQVIKDLAKNKCPFKETQKFADLGTEFTQYNEAIEDITSASKTITVTTKEAHEYTTGDTICILGARGTLAMETALNNVAFTITVVDTTSFTLDDFEGTDGWEHTEDSGIASYLPEIGGYSYAFNLPSDCEVVVRQIDELFSSTEKKRKEYRFEPITNLAGDGKLLLTNHLSNSAGDSAFIEYAFDLTTTTLFSNDLVECIATLLAAELCPICGRDLKTRQQMLMEYEQLSKPGAKAANQSGFNRHAKTKVSYLGGRS